MLTKRDHKLLKLFIHNWNKSSELVEANYKLLIKELENAKIVDEETLPKDVVKLHSSIDIETPYGLLKDYELVSPEKRDPSNRKLSILSPIG